MSWWIDRLGSDDNSSALASVRIDPLSSVTQDGKYVASPEVWNFLVCPQSLRLVLRAFGLESLTQDLTKQERYRLRSANRLSISSARIPPR